MFFSPLGSSRGSRDESGDVARGDGKGGLPLANMVGELSLVGNLGGPPVQGIAVTAGINLTKTYRPRLTLTRLFSH